MRIMILLRINIIPKLILLPIFLLLFLILVMKLCNYCDNILHGRIRQF